MQLIQECSFTATLKGPLPIGAGDPERYAEALRKAGMPEG